MTLSETRSSPCQCTWARGSRGPSRSGRSRDECPGRRARGDREIIRSTPRPVRPCGPRAASPPLDRIVLPRLAGLRPGTCRCGARSGCAGRRASLRPRRGLDPLGHPPAVPVAVPAVARTGHVASASRWRASAFVSVVLIDVSSSRTPGDRAIIRKPPPSARTRGPRAAAPPLDRIVLPRLAGPRPGTCHCGARSGCAGRRARLVRAVASILSAIHRPCGSPCPRSLARATSPRRRAGARPPSPPSSRSMSPAAALPEIAQPSANRLRPHGLAILARLRRRSTASSRRRLAGPRPGRVTAAPAPAAPVAASAFVRTVASILSAIHRPCGSPCPRSLARATSPRRRAGARPPSSTSSRSMSRTASARVASAHERAAAVIRHDAPGPDPGTAVAVLQEIGPDRPQTVSVGTDSRPSRGCAAARPHR